MELIPSNNITTMSTLEIAELTKKQHKHILDKCRKFLIDNKLDTAEFSAMRKAANNQEYEYFKLDKRLSLGLVALIDNDFLMAVIDRWQELEAKTEVISTDPIIAMRQKQIQLEERISAVEDAFDSKYIETTKPRELRKDKPPLGYENKGDVATSVAKITQTTKAIVYAALENYSADISKKTYVVECTDDADNVIETNPICYLTFDVIQAVRHAVKNSEKKTEYFRVFPTLGNKSMKLKVK